MDVCNPMDVKVHCLYMGLAPLGSPVSLPVRYLMRVLLLPLFSKRTA
jgi:hypothetical protein